MRQRRIMAFNRGASDGNHSSAADAAVADVFLLSTRAGGLGINLATARVSPKRIHVQPTIVCCHAQSFTISCANVACAKQSQMRLS